MDFTILQCGRFTSTGASTNLNIRSDVDTMYVLNYSIAGANQTVAVGVEYRWQRGMPQGGGIAYFKSNAANATNLVQTMTGTGFYLLDTSIQQQGAPVAVTAISNGTPPVVSTGSTAGLVANSSIVRLTNIVQAQQLGGLEFTVGAVVANTSFTLAYMQPIAAAAGGGTSTYSIVPFDPIFYPVNRTITNISQATNAIVTLSVTHGYQVGQQVRFNVPAIFGMTQLNGQQATIVAIGQPDANGYTNTITINLDTTAFTAFTFPVTTSGVFTPAQVVPIGEYTPQALSSGVDTLTDATINTAFLGMTLTGGANSPGGAAQNVIYWQAGKAFSVTNS